MKIKIVLTVLLFFMIACATPKINDSSNHVEIPSDIDQHLKLAQSIGSMLYILDKAAAISTDIVVDNVENFWEKDLGGYLTFREAGDDGKPIDSYITIFYTNDNPPKIKYEVHVRMSNDHEFKEFDPPDQASPEISYFTNSREAAIAAIPEITQPLNPVLLPADVFGKEGLVVYLLAGTSESNVAVLGKHYRAFVDPTNDYEVELEPLSKAEIIVPIQENSSGLVVSQIITDWPTEIHVFASLLYKTEIYVATRSGLWKVDGTNISFVKKNN
jgi:hypothetical protein